MRLRLHCAGLAIKLRCFDILKWYRIELDQAIYVSVNINLLEIAHVD